MKIILKIILIIISVFFVKNIYAQNSKFIFEAKFVPNYSYSYDNEEFSKALYKPILLFDAGINFKYNLSEKSIIGNGLFYSSIGNLINFDDIKINIIYDYIELPFFLEYNFYKNLSVETGIAYKRAVYGKIRYKNLPDSLFGYSKEEYKEMLDATYFSKDLKKINFNMNNIGFLLGINQIFNITEKLYIGYGLQFKTNLLPAYHKTETSVSLYHYSIGINLKIGLK